MAGNPSLLLLDDCTAALDAAKEEAFWNNLRSGDSHPSPLLLPHREATVKQSDRVLLYIGENWRTREPTGNSSSGTRTTPGLSVAWNWRNRMPYRTEEIGKVLEGHTGDPPFHRLFREPVNGFCSPSPWRRS